MSNFPAVTAATRKLTDGRPALEVSVSAKRLAHKEISCSFSFARSFFSYDYYDWLLSLSLFEFLCSQPSWQSLYWQLVVVRPSVTTAAAAETVGSLSDPIEAPPAHTRRCPFGLCSLLSEPLRLLLRGAASRLHFFPFSREREMGAVALL